MTIPRRSFIAATAAAAIAGPAFARGRRGDAPFRLALKYGMIQPGDSIEAKLRIARDAGFEGVEIPSPSNLPLDELTAAANATGVEIPGVVNSVHWRDTLGDPDGAVRARGVTAMETAIRDCATVGGSTVLLVPAVVNDRITYAQAWERSIDAIRGVAPQAERAGVMIAIENVWSNFLLSPLEAARYVDECNAGFAEPVVGWYLDIGNLWNTAWPEHWIEALGERIVRLDIKGYSRKKADAEGKWKGFGVPIDGGDLDWSRVRSALDAAGLRGHGMWATAEVGGGDARRLNEIAQRMRRALGIEGS